MTKPLHVTETSLESLLHLLVRPTFLTALFLMMSLKILSKNNVPGCTVMNKELDLFMQELKSKISTRLSEAGKIAVTIDIWSKKGKIESFLGMTTHWFLKMCHRRFKVTLAVRHFPHPHTADRVLEATKDVLQSWGIDESKISKVLTDNGSNMVAAFRNTIYNLDSDLEVVEAIPGTSDDDIDEQLITSSDSEQNDDTQDIEDHNLVLMERMQKTK